ncbi:MAG: hypothetical protein RI947_106 [Candidatus Parcubacteria bacterium]|jgi:hypothetical protein
MKNSEYLIVGSVLGIAIMGIVSFKLFNAHKTKPTTYTTKPVATIKQLPASKKGWKWHIDKIHNIAFQYPEEFTPNNNGRIFTSGTKEIRVLIDNITPNRVFPAIEPASSQVVINSLTWNIKKSYTYCDAGICGSTGITYYIYKYGHLVLIKYFPEDVWPVAEQVISSILFNAQ